VRASRERDSTPAPLSFALARGDEIGDAIAHHNFLSVIERIAPTNLSPRNRLARCALGLAARTTRFHHADRRCGAANVALRVQAERLTAVYVAPSSDRPTTVNELIALFDGPAQREAQMLEARAMGEAWWEHRPGVWPQVTL
jgi:hypothetical protein